jgi:hypothetical protein
MSFVLMPLARHENGRRAAEIVRTCPAGFMKIALPGEWDRLKLAIKASNTCRKMVKSGVLEEVGRVWHTYDPDPQGNAELVYLSPRYRPTESGIAIALGMPWEQLPDLRTPKKKKRKRADKNPFVLEAWEAAREFIRLIE